MLWSASMNTPLPDMVAALELAEVAAARSYTGAAPSGTARELGLALRDIGSALGVRATAFDILMYNRVVGLGVAKPTNEAEIDQTVAFFRDASIPRFMVNLAPGAEPPGLTGWLESRGFYLHNHWLRLYRPTSGVQAPVDPRVRRIGREHADRFARTDAEAFGHPLSMVPWMAATVGRDGWHHYGSFEDGEPVGFAALYAQGRAAWFGFACTRATHRRRGIQSGLIAARLRAAAELGCEFASVETADDTPEKPNPSTHNLRRLGFDDAYRRPNWVLNLVPRPAAPAAQPNA
jgi:GNAT superfamily N-acetyltransferase